MAIIPTPAHQVVTRFFRWWGGELAACLPSRARARVGRGRQRLIVDLLADKAVFTHSKGGDSSVLGEMPISSADLSGQRSASQHQAVEKSIRAAGLQSAEVVLRLPRDKVLRRMVDLPAAAAENLSEVLGFEMDRHTPFKAEEVYYDYRVEARDPEHQRIKIDLMVVPRAVADEAIQLFSSWGLKPNRLVSGGDEIVDSPDFNLLPRSTAASTGSFNRRLSVVLGMAVLALLAVTLYLPLRQKQSVLAETEARLAAIQVQAVQADALKKQVEDMLERSRFVLDRKRQESAVMEILDEVTRILPDQTWVLKFSVRDQRLSLSGYSSKPSALIGLLEQSKMLTETQFSSPVTMDQKVGLERFNLTATIAGRGKGKE